MLLSMQVLINLKIVPFPSFSIHTEWHWILFVVCSFVLLWWTTHYRPNQKKDSFVFCCFCFLSFWHGTVQPAASFPALMYASCSAAVVCQHFKSKWLVLVPFLFFVTMIAITINMRDFSTEVWVSNTIKCIITTISFWIEYRHGTALVSQILLAPVRDFFFLVTAPLAVYALLNG